MAGRERARLGSMVLAAGLVMGLASACLLPGGAARADNGDPVGFVLRQSGHQTNGPPGGGTDGTRGTLGRSLVGRAPSGAEPAGRSVLDERDKPHVAPYTYRGDALGFGEGPGEAGPLQ